MTHDGSSFHVSSSVRGSTMSISSNSAGFGDQGWSRQLDHRVAADVGATDELEQPSRQEPRISHWHSSALGSHLPCQLDAIEVVHAPHLGPDRRVAV
jgi:hypothetical protein